MQDDPHILDLRDMPLFYEDISEESFIPSTGPKRIDGLSPIPNPEDTKPQRTIPWTKLIIILVLLSLTGTALAIKPKVATISRPIVASSRTTAQPSQLTTLPSITSTSQTAYANLLPGLSIHSTPELGSSNTIGAVPFSAAMTILDTSNPAWTLISYQGQAGYVSAYYVVASADQLTGATIPAARVAIESATTPNTSVQPGSGSAGGPETTTPSETPTPSASPSPSPDPTPTPTP